ncbi:histidine kinase [filamentous cyanobacterium LEGE 11480]|uniref:Adaptive-response sensory-kinase SasA n=1 Tax=Romeriopsis navalis LEGE 11480 TaxID=2777977 RepID=A0A928Z4K7_9CYAN|nr:histidine kinase [Romeriopsis navalis]MBE9032731.1 histidine kinase [Romeriopsis navalis LEGE 11480]
MQALPDPLSRSKHPLQLLLFVDRRPVSREQIRQVRQLLEELGDAKDYDLQVIDVTEQPHLAEHFRLLTTPALIKIAPEPRQMMVGSNFLTELRKRWPRWEQEQRQAVAPPPPQASLDQPSKSSGTYELAAASELLELSDEVFRLKQEKAELEAQIKFKDQVISMLAHDLRNPLTAASIALETLDRGFHPKEGQVSGLTPALITQVIRQARSQLRNINGMITDILQTAHGRNAELNIHLQPIALPNLCYDVLESLRDRCEAKSITIETDIPADLPKVYIDEERIRQVLINLVDNAIKYTSDGGKIQLSALHRTTQKVQVSLCDSGLGIPEDQFNLIFDDHVRLQRDQDESGYGIGLNLCQRIIRAHYGQIWVDSVLRQGSCFHFTLPVDIN